MVNAWSTCRTIIEEDSASQSLDDLKAEHERFDEQWIGFSWLLSRSPEKSRKQTIDGIDYHLMHRAGDKRCGLVGIAAVYTYSDNDIILLDVNAWLERSDGEE